MHLQSNRNTRDILCCSFRFRLDWIGFYCGVQCYEEEEELLPLHHGSSSVPSSHLRSTCRKLHRATGGRQPRSSPHRSRSVIPTPCLHTHTPGPAFVPRHTGFLNKLVRVLIFCANTVTAEKTVHWFSKCLAHNLPRFSPRHRGNTKQRGQFVSDGMCVARSSTERAYLVASHLRDRCSIMPTHAHK